MKKSFILLFISVFGITMSCTEDITSLNVNPKSYTNVPAPTLFTNAQRNLVDAMTSANVNRGIFRLVAQQWTETTYLDETQYDLSTRNIPQNFWNSMYRDVLRDFKAARDLITADAGVEAGLKANQLAVTDILEVYTYSVLVATFGDIPYKDEALNFDNLLPKYSDGATIYSDLLTRLNTDITTLSGATTTSFGSADLIYAGSAAKWKKFASSLKVRIGMTIADSDPTKAKSAVETAAAGVFASNADNAILTYLSASPNTNPVWVDLVQSGRQDFVPANTIVDIMNSVNDPRRPFYFTVDAEGGYSGGINGIGNAYATYSHPSTKLTATTFPGVLLDYSEVEFYLAEAAARGWTVGGSANSFYTKGITASITYWGGTTGDADAYLAIPSVNQAISAGNYKQVIGTQKYLALYNRGWEAWTEVRRLDAPTMNPVIKALTDFPIRFIYPVGEQTLNSENYKAASSKIGGDEVTTKLFWDKF